MPSHWQQYINWGKTPALFCAYKLLYDTWSFSYVQTSTHSLPLLWAALIYCTKSSLIELEGSCLNPSSTPSIKDLVSCRLVSEIAFPNVLATRIANLGRVAALEVSYPPALGLWFICKARKWAFGWQTSKQLFLFKLTDPDQLFPADKTQAGFLILPMQFNNILHIWVQLRFVKISKKIRRSVQMLAFLWLIGPTAISYVILDYSY